MTPSATTLLLSALILGISVFGAAVLPWTEKQSREMSVALRTAWDLLRGLALSAFAAPRGQTGLEPSAWAAPPEPPPLPPVWAPPHELGLRRAS